MLDFIKENPIPFKVSNRCCEVCKKATAHAAQKNYEMVITGERRDEGGMRSVPRKDSTSMCFTETADGKFRLRPLYYVSDSDKAWYKEYYGIRYSDSLDKEKKVLEMGFDETAKAEWCPLKECEDNG